VLVVIVGAEMNAEIEHASPHGKAPGEKVPGERKTIGARAAREFATAAVEWQAAAGARSRRVRVGGTAAFARAGVLLSGAIHELFGRRIKG
jgi:hypothetical protein